jgi:hypothetical protein
VLRGFGACSLCKLAEAGRGGETAVAQQKLNFANVDSGRCSSALPGFNRSGESAAP